MSFHACYLTLINGKIFLHQSDIITSSFCVQFLDDIGFLQTDVL